MNGNSSNTNTVVEAVHASGIVRALDGYPRVELKDVIEAGFGARLLFADERMEVAGWLPSGCDTAREDEVDAVLVPKSSPWYHLGGDASLKKRARSRDGDVSSPSSSSSEETSSSSDDDDDDGSDGSSSEETSSSSEDEVEDGGAELKRMKMAQDRSQPLTQRLAAFLSPRIGGDVVQSSAMPSLPQHQPKSNGNVIQRDAETEEAHREGGGKGGGGGGAAGNATSFPRRRVHHFVSLGADDDDEEEQVGSSAPSIPLFAYRLINKSGGMNGTRTTAGWVLSIDCADEKMASRLPTPAKLEAALLACTLTANSATNSRKTTCVVLHFTDDEVVGTAAYQRWIDQSAGALHVMMHGRDAATDYEIGHEASARLVHALSKISSRCFPSARQPMPKSARRTTGIKREDASCAMPSPQMKEGHGCVSNQLSARLLMRLSLSASTGWSIDEPATCSEEDEDGRDETQELQEVHAKNVFDDAVEAGILHDVAGRHDLSVSFFGTGCAEPSKYRGSSSIYLHQSSTSQATTTTTTTTTTSATSSSDGRDTGMNNLRGGVLLDCGEGAYGGFIRRFGIQDASRYAGIRTHATVAANVYVCMICSLFFFPKALTNTPEYVFMHDSKCIVCAWNHSTLLDRHIQGLRCIFISHHHPDHSLGLPALLAARASFRTRGTEAAPPLLLIAPEKVRTWLGLLPVGVLGGTSCDATTSS